jgi:hypothetical protein
LKCDPAQARSLLASAAPQNQLRGLRALDGRPLDADLAKAVKACLASPDGPVRWLAAGVLVRGSSGPLAADAVAAIGDALTVAADQPDAGAPYPRGGGYTNLEMSAGPYIQSLKTARAEDRELSALTQRLRGRARDAVTVARAERGDRSVRQDVGGLARDTEAGMFRAWAATALGVVGTPDDIPALQQLAGSDPLTRTGQSSSTPLPPGKVANIYPVREAAASAIRQIQQTKQGSK